VVELTHCICGTDGGKAYQHAGIDLLMCACGTARRSGDISDVEAQYRSGDYHRSASRHTGCTPYTDRYAHDLRIAALRWERYSAVLGHDKIVGIRTAIDVGCANGAFVDYLLSLRINAWGFEPSPEFSSSRVIAGTLSDFLSRQALSAPKATLAGAANLLTYHDVLEHLPDPEREVVRARAMLARGGVLIVDVPFVWDGRGEHHYKSEHLFYFGRDSLAQICRRAGFRVLAIDEPIPGKLVVYAEVRA
jgi:hypothetical protein